jgi:LPXTG-site transpeptidase (sortase) family protein
MVIQRNFLFMSFSFKGLKNFLKYFLFFIFVFLLVFNWSKISWVFNPKAVFRYLATQFEKELEKEKKAVQKRDDKIQKIEKEDSIEIPKIEISAPLVLVENESQISKALDRGVVLFPKSVFPGKIGQTIILGHSAPKNWPKIKYDWVFSNLNDLEIGDEIFVYFQNKVFKYSVIKKIFLEKGEELPKEENSKNILILISCWPPGKDLKRIAIMAEIKS